MLSNGFQSFCDPFRLSSEDSEDPVGSFGVKLPSSRSLSKMIIVPSANDTKNSVGEEGTQCTDVHGELVMQPALLRRP
jgi:hypothetical protein